MFLYWSTRPANPKSRPVLITTIIKRQSSLFRIKRNSTKSLPRLSLGWPGASLATPALFVLAYVQYLFEVLAWNKISDKVARGCMGHLTKRVIGSKYPIPLSSIKLKLRACSSCSKTCSGNLAEKLKIQLGIFLYSIDPRGRPTVMAGSDHWLFSHMLSVRPQFSKQNKYQLKVMFATGETVGLTEWITDDSCLVSIV